MRLHLGFTRAEWDALPWIDQRMYQEQLDAYLEATAPAARPATAEPAQHPGPAPGPTPDQRLRAMGFRIE